VSSYQVEIKALINAKQLKEALEEAAGKMTIEFPNLKINIDGIKNIVNELKGAATATGDVGKEAENLGTKFTKVYNNAGTLVKVIKDTKLGLYDTQKIAEQLNDKTKKWATTTTLGTDGIKRQADEYQKYLDKYVQEDKVVESLRQQKEEAIKQQEVMQTKMYDAAVKKEQEYQSYLQKELQIRETIEDKADRLLNQFDDSKNKEYQKYLQDLSKENEKYGKTQEDAEKKARENISVLGALEIKVRALTSAQKEQLDIENRLAKIRSTRSITEQSTLMKELNRDISAVTGNMNTFRATIDFAIERFLQFGLIMAVLRNLKQALSSIIENVKELDKSLVEVQKVTDLEGASLELFTRRAYEAGENVARTGKEVIDATAIFARSGYDIKEALDLAEVSLVMMNVGDNIDSVSEAATSLISVLKGYNLEAEKAMDVTSLINEVSNNAAINFEDLTEGLTRTAAVFNQSGVSLENLAGLLTGANEILQNMEKSSTGLITISQRLRSITTEGEDGAVSASKLSKAFKDIANIDIFDSGTGQLRDTYSILEDMARIFPTLTTNQRQYLAELAAGEQNCSNMQKCILRMTLIVWETLRDRYTTA
jgi:TP901 family phage tail tape measure protein